MAAQVFVYPLCFRWGLFGWFLSWMAFNMGTGLWMGYCYLAFHAGELYFVMAAAAGTVTMIVQYMMATLYAPHPLDPFGPVGSVECGGKYTFFLPSLSVAMLAQFVVIALGHILHLNMRVTWAKLLWGCMWIVGVPIVVVVMENSTPLNALYGALVGASVGALMFSLLVLLFLPRMADVAQFLRAFNIDHRPARLAQYNKLHPDNTESSVIMSFL